MSSTGRIILENAHFDRAKRRKFVRHVRKMEQWDGDWQEADRLIVQFVFPDEQTKNICMSAIAKEIQSIYNVNLSI